MGADWVETPELPMGVEVSGADVCNTISVRITAEVAPEKLLIKIAKTRNSEIERIRKILLPIIVFMFSPYFYQ
jgi:hypothetical protein